MKKLILVAALGAVGLCGAGESRRANEIKLPPCGLLVGNAIYNYYGLYPTWGWSTQYASPLELIDRTVKENQGNLVQFWWCAPTDRPLRQSSWLALEDLGFKCPQPDWTNLKSLKTDEFPIFAKYADERAGAGALKALRACESNGLYSMMIYLNKVNPKYAQRFTENPHYLGYDFGETFCLNYSSGEMTNEAPRLDRLAADLTGRIRRHCEDCRAKGYGSIWCTSGSFYMDYEIAGGVDFELFEDLNCDLNIPTALSRGISRQYGHQLWGSHIANEFYTWHTSKDDTFFRSLYGQMMIKYLSGAKVIIAESGAWHCQSPGSDSPLSRVPKIKELFYTPTPPDGELAEKARAVEKMRDEIAEDGAWAKGYRRQMSDFYDYVKKHGTPAGQPEVSFALAKGNYDLSLCWLDGRPKHNQVVGGVSSYAEKHMEWLSGAPEDGWSIAADVFWPFGEGIYGNRWVNRIFSGTPWGQIDIVTFAFDQIDANYLLRNYKTLAFVGWNTCSPKQYKILCDYVKGGGRLFIAIPQLSTDVTRNYQAYTVDDLVNKGDFTELCGLKVTAPGDYFYWATAKGKLPWKGPKQYGAYRGRLGKTVVSNPKAETVLFDDEQGSTVLYRLPSGKGEVWFLNSWFYPGAYDFSYAGGAEAHNRGFVAEILKHLARLTRGMAYLTERGGDDPGDECGYVNFSYFPSTKEVLLFNVDFFKTHRVDLHVGGRTKPLDLKPQELVRIPVD